MASRKLIPGKQLGSPNCLYNTDPEWVETLRREDVRQTANFWRKDKRHLGLSEGANFYFKLRGHDVVVGRGKFSGLAQMSISDAWETFGIGNGVNSLEQLRERAHKVLNVPSGDEEISCIILDDLEFLEPKFYYRVSKEQFPPNILATKFFSDDELADLSRRFSAHSIVSDTIPEQVEVTEDLPEGATRKVRINAYERNREARRRCIEHYGPSCSVCGFNFSEVYGERGEGYIHVHHLLPLSKIGKKYRVNPIKDLRPVCPNCHSMLHWRGALLPLGELRALIRRR